MKKEKTEESFEFSYESDGKMGSEENRGAPQKDEVRDFFNTTQDSE